MTKVERYEVNKPLKRQRSNRSAHSSSTSTARRRQNDIGCVTFLRGTLHCYNVFILLIGCTALGIGIWLLVTDFSARKVTPIVGNQLYEVTTYLLIAGGGSVALLAFCGCCGTIREDKCVLSFYGTTLAIVLIVLGTACSLAFIFRNQLAHEIKIRMEDTLTFNYGIEIRTNTENRRITEAWDAMQRELECCGVSGNITSESSWQFYSTKTYWKSSNLQPPSRRVPDSCCAPGDINLCIGDSDFFGAPNIFPFSLRDFQKKDWKKNPYLYTDGCYDKLVEHLQNYSMIAGAVAAIVPLFLIFGIVISFCLCARVSGYAQEDDV